MTEGAEVEGVVCLLATPAGLLGSRRARVLRAGRGVFSSAG